MLTISATLLVASSGALGNSFALSLYASFARLVDCVVSSTDVGTASAGPSTET